MKQSPVLYESSACLVVNKLKGEKVTGALPLPTPVHRLDAPVTGCALFALTRPALVFLNAAFANNTAKAACESRLVKKIYWAVLEKPPFPLPENSHTGVELTHWIETNSAKNKSYAHNEEAAVLQKAALSKAILHYKIIGEGTNYLFTEIELFTGRHHQIRAQLAAIGMHIKGDLKYGAKRSEKGGGIRLHARSLSFPNPLCKKEIISVTADPPELDNLWSGFLEKNMTL